MSDRERWIVYPLLFLSLGASLRSKVAPIDQLEAHNIRCDTLLEAHNIRCESLVTNQLGNEKMPVGVAWVKEIEAGVARCENALVRHLGCETLNGTPFVIRSRMEKPGSDKPNPDTPKPNAAPAEDKPALKMQ